ncbi:MAG TPA: hypothetical protein ENI82_04030 [Bacteroidetes bacterium]|nr:hypothetical protein [Bacteroidota bacterium]
MKSVFASKYVFLKSLIVVFVILAIGGVVFFAIKHFHLKNENVSNSNKITEEGSKQEKKVYEVLVAVRNQYNPDPEEDKRTSMKKGYVLGVYDDGHKWSETEKKSYLILKMKLTKTEKEKLTQSITEETSRKDDSAEKDEKIIALRKYKINLNKIGFSGPKILIKKQPFLPDKIFDWSIVEEINNG